MAIIVLLVVVIAAVVAVRHQQNRPHLRGISEYDRTMDALHKLSGAPAPTGEVAGDTEPDGARPPAATLTFGAATAPAETAEPADTTVPVTGMLELARVHAAPISRGSVAGRRPHRARTGVT